MEKFYDHLRRKYFVDYDDAEIKDISAAMHTFLRRMCDTFNEIGDVLRIEQIVPCGSMEEKTTIHGEENAAVEFDPNQSVDTIEFDCLAVLKPIVEDMEVKPSCPGYRRLSSHTLANLREEKLRIENSESYQKTLSQHTDNVMDTLRLLLMSKDDIDATSVSSGQKKPVSFETFVKDQIAEHSRSGENLSVCTDLLRLHKYVSGSSKAVAIEFCAMVDLAAETMCQSGEPASDTNEDPCVYKVDTPSGTLQYGRCLPGCQLALSWTSNATSDMYKVIYADFVPAFRVTESNQPLATMKFGRASCAPSNFLVAKGCRVPGCEAGCWRLSHCLAEINSIQTTSQTHRDVYKFLKIFNHSNLTRRSDNALKSYHIKTALLTHIGACQSHEVDIANCLCKTLDIVNSYIDNGTMPHWKDSNYSLILKLDTCHRVVPLLLRYLFGTTVRHSPTRLFLTVCCEVGKGKQQLIRYHKFGNRLSNLICEVIEGKDRYDELENAIIEAFNKAADLAPLDHQTCLEYSMIVETEDNPDNLITIYQRCTNL